MNSRLSSIFLSILFCFLAFVSLKSQSLSNYANPYPEWITIDWAPVKPSGSSLVPQTQDESGEDWWYRHKNVYDGDGQHIGYITCGYTTWPSLLSYEAGCLNCDLTDNEPDCFN